MLGIGLLILTLAQPPAPWALEELTLTNGAKLQGLILEDNAAGVRFQVVRRTPGKPTVTLTTFLFRNEVAKTKKLPDADRTILKEKLAELDPRGAGERQRMSALEVQPAPWLGQPTGAWRYNSDQFALISSAPEEVTRRIAVRLEQIYTAYARFLPPRYPVAKPTTIWLTMDRAEFTKLLGPRATPVLNPAVYEPGTGRILCQTDLRRLGADLAAARTTHQKQLAALDKYEADLRKLYKTRAELDRFLEPVGRDRKKLAAADVVNDGLFDQAMARPNAILYHETFHAYVGNFVYPPGPAGEGAGSPTGELPRWLNEGLAQIFETAMLEAGELRVDHADAVRLAKVQDHLKPGGIGLLPLPELLTGAPTLFILEHATQKTASDRAYLTAWAVAYHLTFERRVLGTSTLDAFLRQCARGGDPRAAFATLVGTDLSTYQTELARYFTKLQPDGTLRK
ncbi:MAG: DUF1570 domain-containing protein [Gemmataceae bacterium]